LSQQITVQPVTVADAVTPESAAGRTAGSFFCDALASNGLQPADGDVLVVSSKLVSFFEGGLIRLKDVLPGRKARFLGRVFGRDPRKLQVLMETGRVLVVLPLKRILAIPSMRRTMIERSANPEAMLRGFSSVNKFTFMVRTHAAYLDEAGIDHTNSPDEFITVLPPDACSAAAAIREAIRDRFGVETAVIVSDTVTSLGRLGAQDMAIGFSGIDPITRQSFSEDLFGAPRSGGIDIVVDSIAGIAGLVMGQTIERTPAVLLRGAKYAPEREDAAERGLSALVYPPGAMARIAFHTLLATAWFQLMNLISFSRWPKKTRSV